MRPTTGDPERRILGVTPLRANQHGSNGGLARCALPYPLGTVVGVRSLMGAAT